jgi:hypothetical protein
MCSRRRRAVHRHRCRGLRGHVLGLVGDPERLLAWHTIFMVLTVLVVARGVASGLEKAVRVADAGAVRAAGGHGALRRPGRRLRRRRRATCSSPDFGKLGAHAGEAILSAMGQAFFSLSLGMGAIMIYGSYLNSRASIGQNAVIIAGMDTLVALLAGWRSSPSSWPTGWSRQRSGADLPDPAHRLRPDAVRVSSSAPVLPAAGVRGLDLGHLAAGAHGGLAGGEPRLQPGAGRDPRGMPSGCSASPACCR